MKFLKYSWGFNEDGSEKYAIVQELDQNSREVNEVKAQLESFGLTADDREGSYAKFVYGSNAKYSKRGQVLLFGKPQTITELDTDKVVQEHFVGLI